MVLTLVARPPACRFYPYRLIKICIKVPGILVISLHVPRSIQKLAYRPQIKGFVRLKRLNFYIIYSHDLNKLAAPIRVSCFRFDVDFENQDKCLIFGENCPYVY